MKKMIKLTPLALFSLFLSNLGFAMVMEQEPPLDQESSILYTYFIGANFSARHDQNEIDIIEIDISPDTVELEEEE